MRFLIKGRLMRQFCARFTRGASPVLARKKADLEKSA